jgi:hypothetical protein
MFTPQGDGSTSYASIESSGKYTAQTGRGFGIRPGTYAVAVVSRAEPTQMTGANGGPGMPGKLITPEWYGSATTSGLTITIEPGSNTHDFELTSTPPAGWVDPNKRRPARR